MSIQNTVKQKRQLSRYFETVAPEWDIWQRRNRFYHSTIQKLIQGIIPPQETILDIGSGTGDMLASLKTLRGVGLNISAELTTLARQKYPHIEFRTVAVDEVELPDGFRPSYITMVNMLDYVYDVWDIIEHVQPHLSEDTLLVIMTSNPLWATILRGASKVGLRIPDSPRNFITNKDIGSVLRLQGFDIVEEGLLLPVPKYIPLIADVLNTLIPELPILRYISSVQYITARPRIDRPALSCSIIIPCHNEEGNIVECVRRVPDMGIWTEIIVVDDGSTDGTRAHVQQLMQEDKRLRLVAFDHNQGKANAVRAGFIAALGDVLMILDADMAVMPEDLPKFFYPLQNGRADFVNGTRLVYPMQGKAMKLTNFLGNKAFCFLISWVIRQRVSDTLCGTKAFFRRDFLRMPLQGKDRWGDFDFLFGAARLRLRILEIPVHYQERRAGSSKMRVLRDGFLFLRACWHGWQALRFPETAPWREQQIDKQSSSSQSLGSDRVVS